MKKKRIDWKEKWKKIKKWIKQQYEYKMMDYAWEHCGGCMYDPYPPSFYYKASPEKLAKVYAEKQKEAEEAMEVIKQWREKKEAEVVRQEKEH